MTPAAVRPLLHFRGAACPPTPAPLDLRACTVEALAVFGLALAGALLGCTPVAPDGGDPPETPPSA